MIRMAAPAPSACAGGWPAAISPVTGSLTGTSARSSARTAYPSIALLSAGGMSLGREDVLAQHAAVGIAQRHRLGWGDGDLGNRHHLGLRLFDGQASR